MDTLSRPYTPHRTAAYWRGGTHHALELAHESGWVLIRGLGLFFCSTQSHHLQLSNSQSAIIAVERVNQVALKVLPSLLAGCTCVLKPSEQAPLSSMIFAQIVHDSG